MYSVHCTQLNVKLQCRLFLFAYNNFFFNTKSSKIIDVIFHVLRDNYFLSTDENRKFFYRHLCIMTFYCCRLSKNVLFIEQNDEFDRDEMMETFYDVNIIYIYIHKRHPHYTHTHIHACILM